MFYSNWIKPLATVAILLVLVWFAPAAPVDPWKLLSPKKVASLILALTVIQVAGSILVHLLGVKAGTILTGFLGGLISSTATTAALAKRSKTSGPENLSAEILTFFSATAAMLFEGVVLLLTGTTDFHFSLWLIFIGPLLVSGLMIYRLTRHVKKSSWSVESAEFRVFPILKLAAFIAVILALSKLLQNTLGQNGLILLTFLVSLFEIHGSVIANLQLHDSGSIGVTLLGSLLAVSVAASYLSKWSLIRTLGSRELSSRATTSTAMLLGSLLVSWVVFLVSHP